MIKKTKEEDLKDSDKIYIYKSWMVVRSLKNGLLSKTDDSDMYSDFIKVKKAYLKGYPSHYKDVIDFMYKTSNFKDLDEEGKNELVENYDELDKASKEYN